MALSYLYVLDLAEGFDRLVVLDLLSGAPLQTMRFGRVGESNLRCISLMAYNQRVILGDAYRHKLLVPEAARRHRGQLVRAPPQPLTPRASWPRPRDPGWS